MPGRPGLHRRRRAQRAPRPVSQLFSRHLGPTAIVQLGKALQEEPGGGILRIDAVNDAFYPWKGYDPELTGNVLSADQANTGCYCTCALERETRHAPARPTRSQQDLEYRRLLRAEQLDARPPVLLRRRLLCAVFFDDLDHRLGGGGTNPPGLGSASTGAQTEIRVFSECTCMTSRRWSSCPKCRA